MNRLQKISGFVLKRRNLLEKDVIVTVFTKENGKMTLMVKGVRKITSKRAAHIQTGNLIRAQIRESKEMYYLQSSELISGFLSLRTEKYIDHIYLFLSIIDGLMPEAQEDEEVFERIQQFFIQLSKKTDHQNVLKINIQKLLEILGYVDRNLSLSELILTAENHMEKRLPRHVL
ncbi:DNA repair protein RecO [Candidatus Roizmanbacteria bacterium CG_4_10_14_0_2_um_filter_39_13]|uniref:DNA repair protein RecO n=1 Tax=Candidatus Roizmanbacteria bacterium CG_4_10_14_0_2_um_filter_39_13 TaxID=1974825 RepID=A0A2M7U0Z7_9BACT|nr:MAG: DNA repair protein RecO [Candidatus Roizmanbacteria bacterium CG_4_10_14_0_2_um_filter_39_13]